MKDRGTWTWNLPAGVPPAVIQAWLTPSWRGHPPEALWEMSRDMDLPGEEESEQLQKATKLFEADAVLLVRLRKTEGSLHLYSLLFIPGLGVANPWEEFDLGPEGRRLAKKLSKAVASFSQLKAKSSNKSNKKHKSNKKKKRKSRKKKKKGKKKKT